MGLWYAPRSPWNLGYNGGTSERIPQLDGLRGVAIAMVIVFHYVNAAVVAGAPRLMDMLIRPVSLGWTGVDLFFVLSGFLIGGILLDARESPNYFRVFYRRRVCRIFPLYYAFLAVAFLAVHFTRSPLSGFCQPAIPWKACAIFCQNFWMAIHNDMGAVMNPTWSLAVEEQFYLTLPVIIYFVRPRRLIWIVTGGIVLAPLIRLTIFLAKPGVTTAIQVLLPCRMDTLLFGVALAYFLRQPGAWEFVCAHSRHLWTAIELLTVACALFLIRGSSTDPLTMLLGYDCFGLLYACVLAASLVDKRLAGVLQAKWLMGLGSIAYCVYLIHLLVFGLVLALMKSHPDSGPIAAFSALVLTIVIARISWRWFEKPFLKLGHKERYGPSTSFQPYRVAVATYAVDVVGQEELSGNLTAQDFELNGFDGRAEVRQVTTGKKRNSFSALVITGEWPEEDQQVLLANNPERKESDEGEEIDNPAHDVVKKALKKWNDAWKKVQKKTAGAEESGDEV